MKVVFMGTPEFACKPLACLHESGHDVVAVVTRPDERSHRGGDLRPTAVKREALRLGLRVLTPEKLKSRALREELVSLQPDAFVVVAFKILPRSLYELPGVGAINIHASLLPRYRGAAPINWALINGETETGLTSFLLNDKVDTGDLVLQERISIADEENFDSLYARLSALAGPFAVRSLDLLADNSFTPLPQDHSQAGPAPKIRPADAMIDWGFPADNVHNFVRGLSTVPGAYTFFRGAKVKIFKARVVADMSLGRDAVPGTILPDKKRLLVQCADSVVEIETVVPAGKKVMDGRSFRNGLQPSPEERFGEVPKDFQDTP